MVENLKCWTNRLMLWDITVWHFPSGGNPYNYLWPSDIFQLAETHNWTTYDRITFSINENQPVGFFLRPSDIFHQTETQRWIFCDRLTFSIRCKPTIWLFVTVWHFPTGRNSPLDYLWPSDIFQHHSLVLDYFLPQMQIVENVRFALSWVWKMCDNVSHFPHLNFEHFPA